MSKSDNEAFSARQEQVLLLASRGLADKQIALELGLSIATIHTYWSRLRKKFGGGNRAELVTLAMSRNATETLTAKESENLRLIGEIVKRAQAERQLAESERKLKAIIENTPPRSS
jgi:DNA-binding CsgD family transcriptional regulator